MTFVFFSQSFTSTCSTILPGIQGSTADPTTHNKHFTSSTTAASIHSSRKSKHSNELCIEIEFSKRYFRKVRDNMYAIPPPNYRFDPTMSKEKLV
jgi:hypothetical protein